MFRPRARALAPLWRTSPRSLRQCISNHALRLKDSQASPKAAVEKEVKQTRIWRVQPSAMRQREEPAEDAIDQIVEDAEEDLEEGATHDVDREKSEAPVAPIWQAVDTRAASLNVTFNPFYSSSMHPEHASYPYAWLRASCTCSACIDPSTKQRRTLPSSDRPQPDVAPRKVEVLRVGGKEGTGHADELQVRWDDRHVSRYTFAWLWTHASGREVAQAQHAPPRRRAWSTSDLRTDALQWPLTAQDRGKALDRLMRYGVVFLSGVPRDGEAIWDVAGQFGEVKNTFYGPTWDVKSVPDSRNVAYTDQELGFHQDLLYMRTPPAYQVLHCIENRVSGGESSLVDGLRVAIQFENDSPKMFSTLTRFPIPFQYVNAGEARFCSHTTIEATPLGDGMDSPYGAPIDLDTTRYIPLYGEGPDRYTIRSINFSPPFQAPLPTSAPPEVQLALHSFADALEDPRNVYKYRMAEGDCVVFDNRRVLHARSGFDADEGPRWLKGCYLEEDAVVDSWRKHGMYEEEGEEDEEDEETEFAELDRTMLAELKELVE
ncbi:Clavaminate synthase-like protein [Calocera cornea HHB12733]|uniref:Clavaminate synthase-like protein n=1 Tax=Calocera cornea HHB12733 TaxID=1353952 RepID=A0A165HHM8_9BASI|nr:Clavaminate synthase-like protein [Calocera cornea HHB12733]